VNAKIMIWRDVLPCSLAARVTLKMEAAVFTEMVATLYENTRRHIPEDHNLNFPQWHTITTNPK
jgi:hypothetical protein